MNDLTDLKTQSYREYNRLLLWLIHFKVVKAYVETNDKLPTCEDTDHEGSWLNVQKKAYKANTLLPIQLEFLQSLKPWRDWCKDPWTLKFDKVKAYFSSNCEASLEPTDFVWKTWWLKCKKDYMKNNLDDQRLLSLRTIPQWKNWQNEHKYKIKKQTVTWRESYEKLKDFVTKHQIFPLSTTPQAVWLNYQKENLNRLCLTL
jgi:hypothetical protein